MRGSDGCGRWWVRQVLILNWCHLTLGMVEGSAREQEPTKPAVRRRNYPSPVRPYLAPCLPLAILRHRHGGMTEAPGHCTNVQSRPSHFAIQARKTGVRRRRFDPERFASVPLACIVPIDTTVGRVDYWDGTWGGHRMARAAFTLHIWRAAGAFGRVRLCCPGWN
jgi:hypothetical protein